MWVGAGWGVSGGGSSGGQGDGQPEGGHQEAAACRPRREDGQAGQLRGQARHRRDRGAGPAVDGVLQPHLDDEQHRAVEAVEHRDRPERERAGHHRHRPEQHQRHAECQPEHPRAQPVRAATQRRARDPGQRDRQHRERHRLDRHPRVLGDEREVLLDRIQPADDARGHERDPQLRPCRHLREAGAQGVEVAVLRVTARRFREPRRQRGRRQADPDAHPPDQRVPADRERDRGRSRRRELAQQPGRRHPALDERVVIGGPERVEAVVEQRLLRTGDQRPTAPRPAARHPTRSPAARRSARRSSRRRRTAPRRAGRAARRRPAAPRRGSAGRVVGQRTVESVKQARRVRLDMRDGWGQVISPERS